MTFFDEMSQFRSVEGGLTRLTVRGTMEGDLGFANIFYCLFNTTFHFTATKNVHRDKKPRILSGNQKFAKNILL